MENWLGLVVGVVVSYVDGFGECVSVLCLFDCVLGCYVKMFGVDKGYDMCDFVWDCWVCKVMFYVVCNDVY